MRIRIHRDDRHIEKRVRGVRLAGFLIPHQLDIAVIGGNEK